MKTNKNGELQSRREFFKSAAKRTLPIIGAAIIASNPVAANAMEVMGGSETGCGTNCNVRCSGCGTACFKGCSNGCSGGCTGCTYK